MRTRRKYRFWKGLALGTLVVGVPAFAYVQHIKAADGLVTPPYVVPGVSSYSKPQTAARSNNLKLLSNCRWGKPGSNPYKGTTTQALQALGLSNDAVARLAPRIDGRHQDSTALIRNAGIVDLSSRQRYDKSMAMTFGHSLCLSTMPNFKLGHTEQGAIYKDGAVTILVPYVCGNISLVTPVATKKPQINKATVHTVPEPNTLWLLGVGLITYLVCRRGFV